MNLIRDNIKMMMNDKAEEVIEKLRSKKDANII